MVKDEKMEKMVINRDVHEEGQDVPRKKKRLGSYKKRRRGGLSKLTGEKRCEMEKVRIKSKQL